MLSLNLWVSLVNICDGCVHSDNEGGCKLNTYHEDCEEGRLSDGKTLLQLKIEAEEAWERLYKNKCSTYNIDGTLLKEE